MRTFNLNIVIGAILNGLQVVVEFARTTVFTWGNFSISLFDAAISFTVLSFVFMIVFPHSDYKELGDDD